LWTRGSDLLWHQGKISPGSEAPFNLADRGLLLADGLFETVLVIQGQPVLLSEHLDRFGRGCSRLSIDFDRTMAERAILDLAAAKAGDAIVRATITRGTGARGLQPPLDAHPVLFATRADWTKALAFTSPRLSVSSIRRNATSPLSRLKSLSYMDNVLALIEAQGKGADDALMLSTTGSVACSSAANVFILEGRRLATPPPEEGVLDGIMRGFILAAAPSMGLDVSEEPFGTDRLMGADAIFLTNSVRLMMPVAAVDGIELPLGSATVARLAAAIAAVAGLEPSTRITASMP
jgi:branched-chain amino acid aminotransferase